MEHIKGTITSLLQSIETKQRTTQEANPYGALKKILTKKEIKHIKLNYFKQGILSCGVDNASWLFQLTLKKQELVEKLRNAHPDITDIRFYLGETK